MVVLFKIKKKEKCKENKIGEAAKARFSLQFWNNQIHGGALSYSYNAKLAMQESIGLLTIAFHNWFPSKTKQCREKRKIELARTKKVIPSTLQKKKKNSGRFKTVQKCKKIVWNQFQTVFPRRFKIV
jgi:hypothetical protein